MDAEEQQSEAKPQTKGENRASYLRRQAVEKKLQIGSFGNCYICCLDEEILFKVFSYLGPNDLMSCSLVCKCWQCLAGDNALWERIYKKYAKTSSSQAAASTSSEHDRLYWKSLAIKHFKKVREKQILPMLKKVNAFTGLSANWEQALNRTCVEWVLCIVDTDNKNHVITNGDVSYFNMSVCVRWYCHGAPPLHKIKKIRVFASIPIVFDKKGPVLENCPHTSRSLLLEMDFKLNDCKPCECSEYPIDIRIAPNKGLLIASFNDGDTLAFITANLHANHLVERCLLGTCEKEYALPKHKPVKDDIDSKYGLHDYSCTIELRNHTKTLWSQQFRSIFSRDGDVRNGCARFVLIDPEKKFDRSPFGKKMSLLWKTEAFKDRIENVCYLDLTLLDERDNPMWCASSAVVMLNRDECGVCYPFNRSVLQYSDSQGRVVITFVWDVKEKQYYIVGLEIFLSLSHINTWFGTKY